MPVERMNRDVKASPEMDSGASARLAAALEALKAPHLRIRRHAVDLLATLLPEDSGLSALHEKPFPLQGVRILGQ